MDRFTVEDCTKKFEIELIRLYPDSKIVQH